MQGDHCYEHTGRRCGEARSGSDERTEQTGPAQGSTQTRGRHAVGLEHTIGCKVAPLSLPRPNPCHAADHEQD